MLVIILEAKKSWPGIVWLLSADNEFRLRQLAADDFKFLVVGGHYVPYGTSRQRQKNRSSG